MSNQPAPVPYQEQLQQFLTPTPLDLTERRFKIKTYNRDKILQILSEVIVSNPDVVSHAFLKHGNYIDLIICNRDKELHTIPFHLGTRSAYSIVSHQDETLTLGEYFNLLLTQQAYPRRIDFKHAAGFIYL